MTKDRLSRSHQETHLANVSYTFTQLYCSPPRSGPTGADLVAAAVPGAFQDLHAAL